MSRNKAGQCRRTLSKPFNSFDELITRQILQQDNVTEYYLAVSRNRVKLRHTELLLPLRAKSDQHLLSDNIFVP